LGAFEAMLREVLLPKEPVTLSPAQVEELSKKLSTMRHDINGFVTVMQLSAELMRMSPDTAEARYKTLTDQPTRITAALKAFSKELEQVLGITR
jgi:hypothetical protein